VVAKGEETRLAAASRRPHDASLVPQPARPVYEIVKKQLDKPAVLVLLPELEKHAAADRRLGHQRFGAAASPVRHKALVGLRLDDLYEVGIRRVLVVQGDTCRVAGEDVI